MDIQEILACLPHRYPMLLIDKVNDITLHKSISAVKNVTCNEPYFQGHFPEYPVMPAVMILETMAQATGILAIKSSGGNGRESIFLFAGIDDARFRKPVVPGDTLTIEVQVERCVRNMWKVNSSASVNGELVASAKLLGTFKANSA